MTGLVVRRVETPVEYEVLASIWDAVTPREPIDLELAQSRAAREPRRLYLLAEREGELVGCGFAGPSQSEGRGFVSPRVLPAARGEGAGTVLLRALCAHLTDAGFASVSAHVDGNVARDVAFAERHGFAVADRQVEQVRAIGGEPDVEEPTGVRFVSIADRPDLLRAAYPLAQQGYEDLAVPYTVTVTLDEWLEEEATIPAASLVALAADEIVAYSGLCAAGDDGAIDGLTVVRRDWRGRGLAVTLKRAKLARAARSGVTEITTWTQEGNDAMRAVNERLGYAYRDVVLSVNRALPL